MTALGASSDGTRVELAGEWAAFLALYRFSGPRRALLLLLLLLAILAFFLEGLGIGLLIPLVQSILGQSGDTAGFGQTMQRLVALLPEEHRPALLGGLVFVLVLLKSVVIYGRHLLAVWLSGEVGRELRDRLFAKTYTLGLLTVQRLGIGRLHNTVDGQVWHVTEGLDAAIRMLASASAALVFVTLLLLISWPLTVVVVLGFAAISLVMLVVRRGAQRVGRRVVSANAAMSERIVEALTQHRLVRASGTASFEAGRFGRTSEDLRQAWLRTELLRGMASPLNELLYVPLLFSVIAIGLAQGLGMATLLAYLLLLYRLQQHLQVLDHLRVELSAMLGPIEDIETVLGMDDPKAPRTGTRPLAAIERGIRFEGVCFDYGVPQSPGLSGVSFVIPKGAVVALIGPSGSGKSTIVGLLHRFFDPTKGRILVDDVPLAELDLAAWRRRLAYAGQDLELMQGSVRDNIAYGSPAAGNAAIREAARLAHADQFIASLTGGYDSVIGARGLTLSGGQRQRLILARALLRQPDLLILDEATNALDAEAEDVVLDRLHAARGGMSLLVIAHRLQTLRHADLVVALDTGRVVEAGPPAALLRGSGTFGRWWGEASTGRRKLTVD